jgi:hypothetical protein
LEKILTQREKDAIKELGDAIQAAEHQTDDGMVIISKRSALVLENILPPVIF